MSLFSRFGGRDNAQFKMYGGITPTRFKQRSLRSRIMATPIPEKLILVIPLDPASAAKLIVKEGDLVLKYQALTEPSNDASTMLHAPTSGLITSIRESQLADPNNTSVSCIEIDCDGEDRAIALHPIADYRQLEPAQLIAKIHAAGICGMGGAGFPSSKKLRIALDGDSQLLIINAAECEPYISADEALIRERASAVVSGAEILQACSLAVRCVIAIEADKVDAIASLTEALSDSQVELVILPAKYPAGGEKQLIQAVSGLQVPAGRLPQDVGVLLHNCGTAYAAHNAIVHGQACISRITTLTGSPLTTPKNFEVLIGTSSDWLFDLCGIDSSIHTGSIIGGSLMGVKLKGDTALLKTSNCLIAMSEPEFPPPAPERACIRCGFCASACPAQLLPQQLFNFARSQNSEQLQDHGLFDCIECGACAYVCPSNIPLLDYYRASKDELRRAKKDQQRSEHWQTRFQSHQYRLRRDKDAALERKNQRPSSNNPAELPPASSQDSSTDAVFSRQQAKLDIAAAVARVQAKKANLIASSSQTGDDKGDLDAN